MKMNPCPKCGSQDVAVHRYDNGWRHVECDECDYLGPGEGSIADAIMAHNVLAAPADADKAAQR